MIDRCNLTILEEPGHEDLAAFLAAHGVEIVASLPCYQVENVEKQRDKGVFEASLKALRRLNALGYGHANSGLVLNLVYNPQGASLPPAQATLKADYKRHLGERYRIVFARLFTLANMPIQRLPAALSLRTGGHRRRAQALRRNLVRGRRTVRQSPGLGCSRGDGWRRIRPGDPVLQRRHQLVQRR